MSQTIDLRKVAPLEAPKPPVEIEPAPIAEPVIEVESSPVMVPSDSSEISWMTHLSPPPRKERVFYIAGILAIAGILTAYLTHDFLFTIVLLLAGLVLVLNTMRPHRPSQIVVHATGIAIDDQRHHYADIKSFWIDYHPHIKEISIEFKKGYQSMMRVPLEDANPLEIRRAMLSYVPEKEHEQSLFDHVIRLIGI
jgi:hypothetical protein